MRLVLATPLYPPEPGGPATYASILMELGVREGLQMRLVKFSDVRHLPSGVRHIAYFWKVLRAARGADAILVLDPVSTGVPAALAAFLSGTPYAVKVVGDYAWEQGTQRFGVTETLDEFAKKKRVPFQVGFFRFLQTRVAKGARLVIVPSKYLKGIVMSWGIPEYKVQVIYNAMKSVAPTPVPSHITTLPRPHVVTAGRLVPWKRVEGVIDAMRELGTGSLIVVGDGPERARLEAHARERLPYTLFTGVLPHADALGIIADADVFVLNSSYEGLSHLLIEALSLGIPSVASAVGGNVELIQNASDGALVTSGDTKALTEGIRTVLARSRKSHPESSIMRFAPRTMVMETVKVLKQIV